MGKHDEVKTLTLTSEAAFVEAKEDISDGYT
jgi:hypothetical protein